MSVNGDLPQSRHAISHSFWLRIFRRHTRITPFFICGIGAPSLQSDWCYDARVILTSATRPRPPKVLVSHKKPSRRGSALPFLLVLPHSCCKRRNSYQTMLAAQDYSRSRSTYFHIGRTSMFRFSFV